MKQFNKNSRKIALTAIFSVVVKKLSLSQFDFECNSFAQTLTFGVIRYYHTINKIIQPLLKKEFNKKDLDIYCILLLGAYQIIYLDTPKYAAINESVNLVNNKLWAKPLVNAILRQIIKYKITTDYSHPKWLIKKIKQQYPTQWEDILKQNNIQAPMTIRVKDNIDDYKKLLVNNGIKSTKIKYIEKALVLDSPTAITNLPNFNYGSCYIQDASAQLAAQLLNPQDKELILDSCAAPGGKTTHIAELSSQATIIALDNNKNRIQKLKQNIKRMQISNVIIVNGDAQNQAWWDNKLFDKILLDSPCSATGIIRRHPDIKLLKKSTDINKLSYLQQQILNNLWQLLKPGGLLLYATCSILKNENEKQIIKFLADNPNAKEEKININWGQGDIGKQQLPSKNFDGFIMLN